MLNVDTVKPAVDFLKHHWHVSIVSLECGHRLNRIDNHLRLMIGLNLKYYVGIDCELDIESLQEELFMDSDAGATLLADYYQNRPEMFREALKLFPGENNLVLWRRRDFIQGDETPSSFRWLRRLGQAFIG